MKILITGATGFIGKHLARRLARSGHEVISCGRNFSKLDNLAENNQPVYLDIRNKTSFQKILRSKKPEAVYHCAAIVRGSSIDMLRNVNAEGTKNVLDACFRENVPKVVHVSSVSVISGNPVSPLTDDLPYKATNSYGQSKLEAEKIALKFRRKGLQVAIIRPCMVYGEDEPHAMTLLLNALKWRIFPIFGDGNTRLHLVSVENVVDVLALCLTKDEAFEGTYLVADEHALPINELFGFMTSVIGCKPPLMFPAWLGRFISRFPYLGLYMSFFFKERVYSIERLKKDLGYVPRISVYDGMTEAILAYKKKKTLK